VTYRVARTQLLASKINFGTSKTQLKFTHVKNGRVGMMDMIHRLKKYDTCFYVNFIYKKEMYKYEERGTKHDRSQDPIDKILASDKFFVAIVFFFHIIDDESVHCGQLWLIRSV